MGTINYTSDSNMFPCGTYDLTVTSSNNNLTDFVVTMSNGTYSKTLSPNDYVYSDGILSFTMPISYEDETSVDLINGDLFN